MSTTTKRCTPCGTQVKVSASNESLSSALNNFITQFFGSVTKTVVNGEVLWTLPCDLDAGIPGFPRNPGEGLACYFIRIYFNTVAIATGVNNFGTVDAMLAAPALSWGLGLTINTYGLLQPTMWLRLAKGDPSAATLADNDDTIRETDDGIAYAIRL